MTKCISNIIVVKIAREIISTLAFSIINNSIRENYCEQRFVEMQRKRGYFAFIKGLELAIESLKNNDIIKIKNNKEEVGVIIPSDTLIEFYEQITKESYKK